MDTNDNWQTFQGGPNRNKHDGRPRVTLDPRGRVRLNDRAYEIFGRPLAVELHYRPETGTIGLSPHNPDAPNAFPVQTPSNYQKYRYRQICASPFCKFHDITPDRTMLFPNIRLDGSGKMLLEITTAIPVGRASTNG